MALVEGSALVFPSAVTERETGLYTCQASFYHHKATTLIQLEVNSEDHELSECFYSIVDLLYEDRQPQYCCAFFLIVVLYQIC